MTGWNLPDGVNVSDIPGNRPEDDADEVFFETLEGALQERSIDITVPDTLTPESKATLEDEIQNALLVARDLAYAEGYNQGSADLSYANDEREYEESLAGAGWQDTGGEG